jgi:hypothetical protein
LAEEYVQALRLVTHLPRASGYVIWQLLNPLVLSVAPPLIDIVESKTG